MKGLRKFIKQDLAMDLGTANTLVYAEDAGIVLNEPTVIAVGDDGAVVEVGSAAKKFLGRTPSGIRAVRPLKKGVIDDFAAASTLIQVFLERAQERKGIMSPRVVIGVPSDITQVEKRSILEAAQKAGVKKIYLMEEIMAAAIGAGLPVHESRPRMVVDIGGGTTEVAVISEWAYVLCKTLRVAGDEMDESIVCWFADHFGLEIGIQTAEAVKWEIGSAIESYEGTDLRYNVAGKSIAKGVPSSLLVSSHDVCPAFKEPLSAIAGAVNEALEGLEPDVRRDVAETGIILTGGGALLARLDELLRSETGVAVHTAGDPLSTVVRGAGRTIEDFDRYRKVFIN